MQSLLNDFLKDLISDGKGVLIWLGCVALFVSIGAAVSWVYRKLEKEVERGSEACVGAGIGTVFALTFGWFTHEGTFTLALLGILWSFAFGYMAGHDNGFKRGKEYGRRYK
jgi:hypothetical protein